MSQFGSPEKRKVSLGESCVKIITLGKIKVHLMTLRASM